MRGLSSARQRPPASRRGVRLPRKAYIVRSRYTYTYTPPSVRPVVSCFSCFPASGALGLGLLLPPPSPPPPFFFFFAPLPPPQLSLAFPAFRLPWAFAPPPPPFSFCLFFPPSFYFFPGCTVRGGFVRLGPSGVPACASVVLSLSLLCVRWLVLCGVGCWAWLSCAVSRWVLVSCFGGAVLVWPRGSRPCVSARCVLVFRCPVLCCVALCCRVLVCCRALPFVCVVACACFLFLAAACLLCVFWGVLLCVPCPLRRVRCCAALCWSTPPPFPLCIMPCGFLPLPRLLVNFLFFTLLPACTHVSTALVIGSRLPSVFVSGPIALMGRDSGWSPAMPRGHPSLAPLSSLPSLLSPHLPPPSPVSRPPSYCCSPASCALRCSSPGQGCISRALTRLWASALSSVL